MIDIKEMPWQQIAPDVHCKVLYKDESSGLSVVLFNFVPGATTPLHEHTVLECTYVLDGSLEDHDSDLTAGNFAARIAGSVHQARAPKASTHIVFFTKPVRNVDGQMTAFSARTEPEKHAPR